jgi:hypothetical protein
MSCGSNVAYGPLEGISGTLGAIWDDHVTPGMLDSAYSDNGLFTRDMGFALTQSNGMGDPKNDPFYTASAVLEQNFNQGCDPVKKLFYSGENMDMIQKLLQNAVLRETNGKITISNQNQEDLQIAMRHVYESYSLYQPDKVHAQVNRLNNLLVAKHIKYIMVNLKQQNSYLRDITRPPLPPPNPINTSTKGRKTLPSITTIWQKSGNTALNHDMRPNAQPYYIPSADPNLPGLHSLPANPAAGYRPFLYNNGATADFPKNSVYSSVKYAN